MHYLRILLQITAFLIAFILAPFFFVHAEDLSNNSRPIAVKALDKEDYKRLIFYDTKLKDFQVKLTNNKLYIETGSPIENNLSSIILVLKGTIKTLSLNESKTGLFIRLKGKHSIRKVVGKDFVGLDVIPQNTSYYQSLDINKGDLIVSYETTATDENTIFEDLQELPSKLEENEPNITFKFDEPVKSSVFVRGGYLWFVADKFKQFSIDEIMEKSNEAIIYGEYVRNRNYTILRLSLGKEVFPDVTKIDESTINIKLSNTPPAVGAVPSLNLSNSLLHGSSIVLDIDDDPKPLRVLDPSVGDEIVIFPVSNPDMHVPSVLMYTDYNVIETSQGIAVSLKSDNVEFEFDKDDITISGPTNRLASNAQAALLAIQERERLARLKLAKARENVREVTLFKFNNWIGNRDLTYAENLKKIEWNIIESDWSNKLGPRLDLARFYLANMLAQEAEGVLDVIEEYHPDVSKSNDFLLLKGASAYLMGRHIDAIGYFEEVNLEKFSANEKLEFNFWLYAAKFSNSRKIHVDKFISTTKDVNKKKKEVNLDDQQEVTRLVLETSERLLKLIKEVDEDFATTDEVETLETMARFVSSHYKESIKRFQQDVNLQKGGAFEAEEGDLWWGLSGNRVVKDIDFQFSKSKDVFLKSYPDRLYNDFALIAIEERIDLGDLNAAEFVIANFKPEERIHILNSLEFLKGLLLAKDGEVKRAEETWLAVMDDITDRFNRARAKFALATLRFNQKEIKAEEAIEELKNTLFIWRGDALELNILKLLGQLHMDQRNYMEGFRAWREIVSIFPGSDEALITARKMSEAFVRLFNQDDADKVPVVQALTLFYEFRELTPIGKLGDDIIGKLVDRLVKVDLLGRAAALLTHQVRFRLQGEERDIASTHLAEIHFMNNNPQLAYDVLTATDHPDIEKENALKRRYLTANALIKLERNNKALSFLRNDYSETASFLRSKIYWNKKIWRKVVDELEPTFRDIRREEKVLTEEQSEHLLKLSVAYAILERKKRLQILYEDFRDFIEDPKKQQILSFVAADGGPVDHRDLDYSVGYNNIQKFLNSYLERNSANSDNEAVPAS